MIWRKKFRRDRVFVYFSTLWVWKNEKFCLNERKFRAINSLKTFFLVKTLLLSRNFCQKSVREKIRNFHTAAVVCTLWKSRNFTATVFTQNFRQINVLLKNFSIKWFDEKILRGMAENFPLNRWACYVSLTKFLNNELIIDHIV